MLRRYAAPEQADVLERAATDLEEGWRAWIEEVLPIRRAAAESGYSHGSLRRMVREGVLVNRSDKSGEYAFRRADLPRKPGAYATSPPAAAEEKPAVAVPFVPPAGSRRQIARAVASRRA